MKADIDKLRKALANGDCSTSEFALCSMKSWFNTASTISPVEPTKDAKALIRP